MINDYGLFKYPDYTLPLSVKMAEVSRDYGLDVLHVHYAVPHATAAILARSMLPAGKKPRVVTTLHGTDTTLLGRDAGYGPAISHALAQSDAVTTVSEFLRRETERLLRVKRPIDVIHNFFDPKKPTRSRAVVRRELGLGKKTMILHASNLRAPKRIDLLLEAVARVRPAEAFKLVILAGGDFAPFEDDVRRLGLGDRIVLRQNVAEIEDYFQAADVGLFTSESESFCLSILEAMNFGCPSVATAVGGIPEVVETGKSGLLVPFGDADGLARAGVIDRQSRAPACHGPGREAARPRAVFRGQDRAALRSALPPRVRGAGLLRVTTSADGWSALPHAAVRIDYDARELGV